MPNSSKMYGSWQRTHSRKTQELRVADKIRLLMPQLIEDRLPSLNHSPVDVARYEMEIALFLEFLRSEFSDLKQLRLAHQFLASFVEQGNQDGLWALKVPPRLMPVTRSRVTRNRRFFTRGLKIGELYRAWRSDLAVRPSLKHVVFDKCLADVLVSSVIHGGLAAPKAVVALANLLQEQRPLQRLGSQVWVDLIWDPEKGAESYQVINSEGIAQWKSLRRFYPDPLTLGLMNLFLSRCRNEVKSFDEKSTWYLMQARLGSVADGRGVGYFSNLSSFCDGALSITEMLDGVDLPQALMECARGKTVTCSFTPDDHKRWLGNGSQSPVSQMPIRFLELRNPTIRSTTKEKLNSFKAKASGGLVSRIHYALRPHETFIKRSSSQAATEMSNLIAESETDAMWVLIGWLHESLQRLKISSVNRYFVELKDPWLFFMQDQEFEALTESDWIDLYSQMLEQRREAKSREYLKGRLAQLHEFIVRQMDVPALSEFFANSSSSHRRIRVRTGMIPETVFQYMLSRLRFIEDLDHLTIEGLKLLLILAYRTGMRRGELLKLRLADVEYSHQLWVFIRNNRYGNNKSTSALRKLPPHALLLPHEFEALKHYVGRRRAQFGSQANTLLFSLPSSETVPLDARAVSEIVKLLLSEQGSGHLTFHHLRHSAINNLMIAINEDEGLIEQLSPYSVKQATYIRKLIFSVNNDSQRDRYWALAGVAGHLTPETTFSNYIHCSDLVLARRLGNYNPVMSLTESRSVSGIPTRAFQKLATVESVASEKEAFYSLATLQTEVLQRLSKYCIDHNDGGERPEVEELVPVQRVVSTQDCYAALGYLETGESTAVVAMHYGLEEQLVEKWLESALALQGLITTQGHPRLFHRDRKGGHYKLPLLPAKPNDRKVRMEIDKYVAGLRGVFKQDRQGLLWSINYWLSKTHTSGAGLRFKSTEELDKFIRPLSCVIPLERWRLTVIWADGVRFDHDWSKVIRHTKVISSNRKGSSFAKLYLSHPDETAILEKRKGGLQSYSSPALRYVFHMLAIMIGLTSFDLKL